MVSDYCGESYISEIATALLGRLASMVGGHALLCCLDTYIMIREMNISLAGALAKVCSFICQSQPGNLIPLLAVPHYGLDLKWILSCQILCCYVVLSVPSISPTICRFVPSGIFCLESKAQSTVRVEHPSRGVGTQSLAPSLSWFRCSKSLF